jgi:hypothetical protein
MFEKFLFEIPKHLEFGLASGRLERFGTVIKSVETGKIVAHIQETGVGQQLMSSIVGSPFSALDTASSLVANVQIARMRKMVESLQMLQYANLGIAFAGIGVSVVGFAVVSKKLNSITQSIEVLSNKIDLKFAELYLNQLHMDLHNLRGVLEGIEATKRLSNPRPELLSLASRLAELRSGMRGHIEHHLQQDSFNEQLFTQLTSALFLSDSARIEAYLLADEHESALYNAESVGKSYCELFDDITYYDLSQKKPMTRDNSCVQVAKNSKQPAVCLKSIVTGLRDITDAALTKPFLIEDLRARGISGLDYFNSLRGETSEPFVLLQFEG